MKRDYATSYQQTLGSSMKQLVTVREATQEDFKAILLLANQLSESIHVHEQYLLSSFSAFLLDDNHCLLVVTEDSTIIGYLSAYFHQAIYANGRVAYIDEIVIDSLHRGSKAGTELMNYFEAIAKQHQCILVSLATFGAKGFYEKLGYTTKAGYYKKYLT